MRSLDFHHKDPNTKEFSIGKEGCIGWEKVKKEIDKCILVCSNCHGEIHDKLDKNTDVFPLPDEQ